MIEPKLIELINLKLDGEITAEQDAELEKTLAADAEAKRYHDELCAMNDVLAKAETHEPPRALKARILNALPAKDAPSVTRLPRSIGERLTSRWVYSFGLGLAAGVFIALAGAKFARQPPLPRSELVGTLASPEASQRLQVAHDLVSGEIVVERLNTGIRLHFALLPQQPLTARLTFDSEAIALAALEADAGLGQPLTLGEGHLELRVPEKSALTLTFQHGTQQPATLRLSLVANQRVLYERTVRTGGE